MTQPDTAVADITAQAQRQDNAFLLTPPPTATAMSVTKRNGGQEPVDLNKIVRAVQRNCEGLHAVDPMRVATRTISGHPCNSPSARTRHRTRELGVGIQS